MGLSYDLSGDFFISLVGFSAVLLALAIAGIWATPPETATL
jgi:cyanate permease